LIGINRILGKIEATLAESVISISGAPRMLLFKKVLKLYFLGFVNYEINMTLSMMQLTGMQNFSAKLFILCATQI
jgi:hypothetical protein